MYLPTVIDTPIFDGRKSGRATIPFPGSLSQARRYCFYQKTWKEPSEIIGYGSCWWIPFKPREMETMTLEVGYVFYSMCSLRR